MNRRQLNLQDLDAVVADARMLHDRGYQRAGEWDLAQAAGHCAGAMNSSIDGFDFAPPALLKLMIKVLGMKRKMYRTRSIRPGLPAPASAVPESAHGDRDAEAESVERLAAAVERLKNHRGPFAPNPGFGELSREEWLEFHTIHTMHHLSFLIPAIATEAAA